MTRSTLASLLLGIITCSCVGAFLIPAHREVTENALASFPRTIIPDVDRAAMIRGCIEFDNDHGPAA